ncbi:ABC transporter permease [bacterium LRH843]|nr:ABC transporter permease [bacterium LRH843]
MSIKGLVRKEWKQSKLILIMLSILFVFHYPMRAILGLGDWRERAGEEYFMPEFEVPSIFGPSLPSFLILLLLVYLAVQFIGTERNTRRHDFSFALPFKRSTMYFVKWLVGVGVVTVAILVTFTSAYILVSTSEFGMYLNSGDISFLTLFFTHLFGYIAMYSFALFIGTFTGEMGSQIALTIIFTIFPAGIIILLSSFLDLHAPWLLKYLHEQFQFLQKLVWPLYTMMSVINGPISVNLLYPIIATALFLFVGAWLYERNPSEHNGEFLLFKQLEPIFRVGIVVCFALLGGMIVSGLVPYTLTGSTQILFYWIGFFIFLLLSFLLTRRLFAMNITVKGK